MSLDEWLRGKNLTDGEFARRIGCSHTTVSRLRRGLLWPSKETAAAIRDATAGAVTANDFVPEAQPDDA